MGPEQLGEIGDFAQRERVYRLPVAQNLFEQRLLPQTPDGILIVVDRVDGDGCLGQPVRQSLFLEGERLEALGFELHEARSADALHQRRILSGQRRAGEEKKEYAAQEITSWHYGIACGGFGLS